MTARVLCALILAGGVCSPLAAQVSIRVVDSEGRPVPAVRVDVLGLGELLGTKSTSASGSAELRYDPWSDVRRIMLSHLGFQTLIVQADEIPADGVIRLEPEATPIEGLMVEAKELCPVTDDPRARRLWSEVAGLYATDTGYRAWSAYMSLYGGSARDEDLHQTPDAESVDYIAAGHPGVIHGGDYTPRTLDDRIATEGYAWAPLVIGGTTSWRESAWGYPELDRSQAYHFASPVFGLLHDFSVASQSAEKATLVFCGRRDGDKATISGMIRLVPGKAFLDAEWRFKTRDPDEGAGGSVTFSSYVETTGSRPHLVASRGLYYRLTGASARNRDAPHRYARQVTTKARWYLFPSADHPCNTGLSYFPNPSSTAQGIRFAECVAEHWGRE